MTTVTLTHEKIREAAATSPEAKKALQVLAPEAFEPVYLLKDNWSDEGKAFKDAARALGLQSGSMQVLDGALPGSTRQGFYLSSDYRWELKTTPYGGYALLPHPKEAR